MSQNKSPRTAIRGHTKSGKSNWLKEIYLSLSPSVNLHSCWFCDFIHNHIIGRNTRRRIRCVCSLTGKAVAPETAACSFFTAEVQHGC